MIDKVIKNINELQQNINTRDESVSRSPFSVTSRDAVLSAIEEFNLIGRNTFLKKYGYRKAVSYLLLNNLIMIL